jgi:His/Glu/Gln/Arg/opine family amino acid ABC transporter permease subunit
VVNWEYIANLDFMLAWEFRQALLSGLGITVVFFVLGGGLGFVGGTCLTILHRSGARPLPWLVTGFIELFRNTPLLVQLMWIHFALPTITGIRMSVFESSLLALSLNISAYMSEVIRAGIDAVPKSQWEASRALGLGPGVIWLRVILPQALRIVLPPMANTMVSLLKGTAILSILSVAELMRATTRISTYTARPVELFTVAALIYFLVGLVTVHIFAWLERRFQLRTG